MASYTYFPLRRSQPFFLSTLHNKSNDKSFSNKPDLFKIKWINLTYIFMFVIEYRGSGQLSRYSVSLWTGQSGHLIPVRDEIFLTRPDRPWSPHNLLCNGDLVSLPGVKRPECGLNHPPSSITKVKERIKLLLWAFMACFRMDFTFNFILAFYLYFIM